MQAGDGRAGVRLKRAREPGDARASKRASEDGVDFGAGSVVPRQLSIDDAPTEAKQAEEEAAVMKQDEDAAAGAVAGAGGGGELRLDYTFWNSNFFGELQGFELESYEQSLARCHEMGMQSLATVLTERTELRITSLQLCGGLRLTADDLLVLLQLPALNHPACKVSSLKLSQCCGVWPRMEDFTAVECAVEVRVLHDLAQPCLLRRLMVLDLEECYFGNDGLRTLASILHRPGCGLKSLNINYNEISDAW